jgi:NAD(P)-dependent dehydrogenase (short-subunit alcohol dehydrogenase family)
VEEQAVALMGASSGIGRETALRFAHRGAKVVVSARGEEGLALETAFALTREEAERRQRGVRQIRRNGSLCTPAGRCGVHPACRNPGSFCGRPSGWLYSRLRIPTSENPYKHLRE